MKTNEIIIISVVVGFTAIIGGILYGTKPQILNNNFEQSLAEPKNFQPPLNQKPEEEYSDDYRYSLDSDHQIENNPDIYRPSLGGKNKKSKNKRKLKKNNKKSRRNKIKKNL